MTDSRSVTLSSVFRALEQQHQRSNMANSLALSSSSDHQVGAPYPHPQQKHNVKHNPPHHHHHRSNKDPNSLSPPLCEQSSAAAVDIVILLLVLGACGFLFTPYFKFMAREAAEILPLTLLVIGEVVYQAPIAYASGALLMFVSAIGVWEVYQYKARRCDSPHCKGLRRSMELDIQLQTEKCLKAGAGAGAGTGPSSQSGAVSGEEIPWRDGIEICRDQKELEAELRRMAPPNGRAVLIFRAPCGCPTVRFEAWGSKKGRRTKK